MFLKFDFFFKMLIKIFDEEVKSLQLLFYIYIYIKTKINIKNSPYKYTIHLIQNLIFFFLTILVITTERFRKHIHDVLLLSFSV